MDTAVEEGRLAEPEIFARNRPVVIVPAGIEEFRDLADANARIVLAEDGVPTAEYTEDILANAGAEYAGNLKRRVLDQIVSREANVRAPVLRVALGEGDATFVYTSDAATHIRDQVQAMEMPQNLNVLATYPIAAIEKSQNPELAHGWIDLVLSGEGQRLLEEYGFLPKS